MSKKARRFSWALFVILLSAVFVYRDDLVGVNSVRARIPVATSHFSTSVFYHVVRVVDGDTIDVDVGGQKVRLRLIGINTPEIVDPRKPVECFGKEASQKAEGLLSGKSVRIETDTTQGSLDKYGRTLAYIFLSDGTLFNKEMIVEGYAHEYTYRYPHKYQNEFKAAERSAREGERGLWAPGICTR